MKLLFSNSGHLPDTDLLVLPISASQLKAKKAWAQLDKSFRNQLLAALKKFDFKALPLQHITISQLGARPSHILMVGIEDSKQINPIERGQMLRKLGALVQAKACKYRCSSIVLFTAPAIVSENNGLTALLEGFNLGRYSFVRYKSKAKDSPHAPSQLMLWPSKLKASKAESIAHAVSMGVSLARDLINTPALDCTPLSLTKSAQSLARSHGLKVRIFDRGQLERMKAGAILAVARGSAQPPFLITLTLKPKKSVRRSLALVGKGVTFDSGGLSIKTASGMETMKYDMSGAAAVLGSMSALCALRPNVEVRAYIPASENMISGSAIRPGDVVQAMNGTTIEILNTDAEGRLLLADALHLAQSEKPDAIIDLATLTGACRIALGLEYAALFSDDEKLCQRLLKASQEAGEHLWRMPLAPEYKALIKSPIADIKNTAGSYGGAITAALFLKEFVGKSPWAHIDIAGPAYSESDKGYIKKGGVGFGVGTLVRYVLSL